MFPHTKLYPSSVASAVPRHKCKRKPTSWAGESIRKDPGWFQEITIAKMNLFQGFLRIFTRGGNKCGRRGMFYKSENIHRFFCRGLHLSQNAADLTMKQSYLSPHLSLYGFIKSSLLPSLFFTIYLHFWKPGDFMYLGCVWFYCLYVTAGNLAEL